MSLMKRSKIPFSDLYVLLTVCGTILNSPQNGSVIHKLVGKNAVTRREYMKVTAGPGLWAPEPSTTFDQLEKTEFPFKTTCEI